MCALSPLIMVACGDGFALPDTAPTSDAEVQNPVRVLVAPSEGASGPATVYFQNADSTLVLATRTDGGGHATGFLKAPGFVTVVEAVGGVVSIYTYAAISPGDTVYIRPELRVPAPQLTVRALPTAPSNILELRTACSTQFSGTEVTQMNLVGCTDSTDVMVLPTGTSYAFTNDVQLGATATIQMPSYRAFEPSTFKVTGIEDNAALMIDHASAIGSRVFSTGADFLQSSGGAVELTRLLPLPDGGITRSAIEPERADWPRVITWQPSSAMVTVSYSPSNWPVTSALRFEANAMTVLWDEEPHENKARASYASLQWSGSRSFRWQIVAPRSEEPIVRLPTLPDTTLRPPADAFVTLAPLYVDGTAEHGLHRVLGTWEPWSASGWPVVGDEGRVVWRTMNN